MEEWRIIEEFNNYEVSNLGRVRNIKKNKLMTISKRPNGYCVVKLSKANTAKECRVHRLVAIAFIPNPNHYDCINHIDENKENNQVENLEWCNHQYNNTYGNRVAKQAKTISKKVKQCDIHGNILHEYESINKAAESVGIFACNISNCLSGRQKSAPRNIYTWKF